MLTSSSPLPQTSAFLCEFCDSSSYVYCKFKNYLTNFDKAFYSENDTETSQSSDNQEFRKILPITSESEKPINPLMLDMPEINVAGVNSKKRYTVTSNKKQPEGSNINLANNFTDYPKRLDIPKTTVKRKLFDTVVSETPAKKVAVKSKIAKDETYKFLPGLSDSVADNFLQKFDQEIGLGFAGESVNKSTEGSSEINRGDHRNLCKERADQSQGKAAALLKEEVLSPSGGRDCHNQSDLTSALDESNTSRYGRIRKPSSIYINATMFKGSIKKSAETERQASTVINSHKCQTGSPVEAIPRNCPDQFDILSRPPKGMVSSQFKKYATKIITPSKNSRTTRKVQSNTRNTSWRNSSFIDRLPELPRIQTTSSAAELSSSNEKLGLQNEASGQSVLIGDYPEKLSRPRNKAVCPRCKKTAPRKKDLFKKPLATNEFRSIRSFKNNGDSPKSQKIIVDDCGKKFDPNEIHAVVKDKVLSFKWYSAMPDLDSILGNGANVYYSMCDLKSFYTNVTVGYLKIDAGHKKPMTVLKDYILLYFVERGNGIFQVSGRKIAGQIGSTVFIPLGVEYAITNSNTGEDLILKFVIISPII